MSRALKAAVFTGAALAGLALYNRTLARRAERRWPPRGRFVDVNACRLHYLERGRGRPVVLLHGASGSLQDFAAGLLDDVAREYRAIAIDRPGHGYSTRPNGPMDPAGQAAIIRAALHRLRVERPILIGHSWSGALVLAYALKWPQEIAGVVTVAGVSHPWTGNYLSWHTRIAAIPVLGTLFAHVLLGPLGQFLIEPGIRGVFGPEAPIPNYARRAAVPLLLRPAQFQANAHDLLGLNGFLRQQSQSYPRVRVPVGIVAPTEDRRITNVERHSHRLYRRLSHSRLFVAEGAGHMVHHTRPEVVVEAIRWVDSEADARQHVRS